MRTSLAVACAILSAVSYGCAATGAYLQQHPEHADEAAIAAAAINCVDHAAAGVIAEDGAEVILAQALACAANIFAGQALAATEKAIAREVVSRQARAYRSLRATRELPPNPYPSVAVPK